MGDGGGSAWGSRVLATDGACPAPPRASPAHCVRAPLRWSEGGVRGDCAALLDSGFRRNDGVGVGGMVDARRRSAAPLRLGHTPACVAALARVPFRRGRKGRGFRRCGDLRRLPLSAPGIPRSLRSRPLTLERRGRGFRRCGDLRRLSLSAPCIPRSLRSRPLTLERRGRTGRVRRRMDVPSAEAPAFAGMTGVGVGG